MKRCGHREGAEVFQGRKWIHGLSLFPQQYRKEAPDYRVEDFLRFGGPGEGSWQSWKKGA